VVKGQWATANASVNQAPVAVSVGPASGSGSSQTFTVTASDANGGSDVSEVYLLANAGLNGAGGCFAGYSRSNNQIRLMNDAGSGWLGPITAGSGSLSNSQCTINGAGSSASVSGNNFTASISITFAAGFAGGKNLYMLAVDSAGANSGYHTLGTWTVP
jgi:hypothetical protein